MEEYMDYFRTQYEKCYEGEEYYWGLNLPLFLTTCLKLPKNHLLT